MLIGFTGEHECKLDSKGRLILPARLRNKLPDISDKELVLRRMLEGNITIYPPKIFEKVAARLDDLDEFNEADQLFKRNFSSSIDVVEMDDSFRFLIPKKFIEFLGLSKEVTLVGMRDKIEIWDRKKWAEAQIVDPEEFNKLSGVVMGNRTKKEIE